MYNFNINLLARDKKLLLINIKTQHLFRYLIIMTHIFKCILKINSPTNSRLNLEWNKKLKKRKRNIFFCDFISYC